MNLAPGPLSGPRPYLSPETAHEGKMYTIKQLGLSGSEDRLQVGSPEEVLTFGAAWQKNGPVFVECPNGLTFPFEIFQTQMVEGNVRFGLPDGSR